MNSKLLDLTKPVRSVAQKLPARILCTDRAAGHNNEGVVVLVKDSNGVEWCHLISPYGAPLGGVRPIIENVPETVIRYMNVYEDGTASYQNLTEANVYARNHRLSLLKVEFLEGNIVSWEKIE